MQSRSIANYKQLRPIKNCIQLYNTKLNQERGNHFLLSINLWNSARLSFPSLLASNLWKQIATWIEKLWQWELNILNYFSLLYLHTGKLRLKFELLSNYWKYLRSAYLENQLNLFPREVLWSLFNRVGLISSLRLWIHIDNNSCLLSLLFTVPVVTIKSQGRRKVRKKWKYLHKLLSCDKTILVPVKELKSQSDIQHPNHEWCPHKISEFSSSSEFCITP